MKLTKTKLITITLATLLVGGGTIATITHQNQVRAEQAALAKEKSDYAKLKKKVASAVQTAYDTRGNEPIQEAEKLAKKLKKADQKEPAENLQKLQGFLEQIKKTVGLLETAEKSKKDEDVANTQKAIDEEKDTYLAKDKTAHQERLDKLKKAIADEKAKKAAEEKAKKEAEEKAKAEAVAQANAEAAVQAQASQVNETYTAPQTEQPTYQAPVESNPAPVQQQAPQEVAPAPSQSGGGSGYANSPGPNGNGIGGATEAEMNESEANGKDDWSEFYK